jgi:hypothetical protein
MLGTQSSLDSKSAHVRWFLCPVCQPGSICRDHQKENSLFKCRFGQPAIRAWSRTYQGGESDTESPDSGFQSLGCPRYRNKVSRFGLDDPAAKPSTSGHPRSCCSIVRVTKDCGIQTPGDWVKGDVNSSVGLERTSKHAAAADLRVDMVKGWIWPALSFEPCYGGGMSSGLSRLQEGCFRAPTAHAKYFRLKATSGQPVRSRQFRYRASEGTAPPRRRRSSGCGNCWLRTQL